VPGQRAIYKYIYFSILNETNRLYMQIYRRQRQHVYEAMRM